MKTFQVQLGPRSYPIHIGSGLLSRDELWGEHVGERDVFVLTNDTVGPLYQESLRAGLARARRVASHQLPDGEQHKTLQTLSGVIDRLVAEGLHRDAVIVALGGGVVGDVAGFAAACYQRGIDYLQAPTTLLAQVDASVGGKTAVNHPQGKNLIGAFYQPRCVVVDTATLDTLGEREYRAGLAEVIKYGLIRDQAFFSWLEQRMPALLERDAEALSRVIEVCCRCKARIVAADEREHDTRAHLNLGHTFGHAIEAVQGYGDWLHGEAVAAGLALAAKLSVRLGLLQAPARDRITALVERIGLPTEPPPVEARQLLQAMSRDKKIAGGQLRFVLLRDIGEAVVTSEVTEPELHEVLRSGARA